MNQSDNINELAAALAKAQGEILPAIKDSSNPFFKSKYADLTAVWNACRAPLSKNGLAVIQTMDSKEGEVILTTILAHSSGQWIKSLIPVVTKNKDAQEYGKSLTYFRRYSLSALVGVSPDDDDDGNTANANPPRKNESNQKKNDSVYISEIERKALDDLLSSDDEEKANVLAHFKISSLAYIPKEYYKQLYSACFKNIEERKRSSKFEEFAQ